MDVTRLSVADRGHVLDGVVRAGESWAAAARRTCASMGFAPVALDLSGEVKRFVIDHEVQVALRPMTRGDLPLMARWRAAPHVARWWTGDGPPTLPAVTAKYGPRIDGMSATRMWIAEVNGRSVGFVQDYRLRDYPNYAVLTPDPDAIGCDYAVGDPHWVGRGIGTRMLWEWALRAHRRFPGARTLFAAPDHRNAASRRMLEKVGFVAGTWFDEPLADGSVDTVVGCSLDVCRVLGAIEPGDPT